MDIADFNLEAITYCRIATALYKTVEIQQNIDDIYPEVEKDIIIF